MAAALAHVGSIGDVHAEDGRLGAALLHLARERVEAILCTGDIVDGPGDAVRCVALLEAAGALVVRGNHDRWLLAARMRDLNDATPLERLPPAALSYLAALPPTRRLETVAGPLLLCHGVGANDMTMLGEHDEGYALESNLDLDQLVAERQYSFAIGGHTHRRFLRRFGNLTWINAGTLLRGHGPGFAIVDFHALRVEWFDIAETLSIASAGVTAFPPVT